MQPFAPLSIPLTGQRLVEASAGTGKTYSISLLYLRFIVEEQLDVDQILVVTFTTAATEELRNRIRNRLRDILDLLEQSGREGRGSSDPLYEEFISSLPDPSEARVRLQDALTRMDEAAVYTIHSFCQRMLQDHAFESGLPFEIDFIESEEQLRLRIVEDFWRQQFYYIGAAQARWVLAHWQGPSALADDLRIFLNKPLAETVPPVTEPELSQIRSETEALWQQISLEWPQVSGEVMQLLADDACLSRNSKNGYAAACLEVIQAGMDDLATMPAMPWILPEKVELLAPSVMAGKLIKKKIAPSHPFLALFDRFYASHGEFLRTARIFTLAEARQFLRTELDRRKSKQAQMYFNDLLEHLDRALAGKGGKQLADQIRARFRVALVDEFQDTDPLQYRIFHTLFGSGQVSGLFMIGDPKQSIYSFRGADIFAYIQAGHDTRASSSYTMSTNYRATSGMVEAVNRIFDRPGAFVFSGEIDFHQVRPAPGADENLLLLRGEVVRPLQIQFLDIEGHAASGRPVIAKDRAEAGAADWTALEIARLLSMGEKGEALIGDVPLAGGDLAILVRTHREAEIMQQSLRQLHIASVYYSQDSVYETEEALQMEQVLAAVNDPADEGQVCRALVTDLFGLDARTLYEVRNDRLIWSTLGAELEEYRNLWDHAGITAMFQRLLAKRGAVRRLVGLSGGERKLTNFLHLVELLQDASVRYRGSDLVSWLRQQVRSPEKNSANQQLRLESDENLVKIVTVHKAKGLEYPVVFLPFLWGARPVKSGEIFSCHVPEKNGYRLVVDLGSGSEDLFQQAEKERLAEDLRLLYVALTRAKHCCYLAWGRVNNMECSALAWLLHGASHERPFVALLPDEKQIEEDLQAINNGRDLLAFVPRPGLDESPPRRVKSPSDDLAVRSFGGKIDLSWTVASYSKLIAGQVHFSGEEAQQEMAPSSRVAETGSMSVFTFPRGAFAGNCLHGLLESLDFSGFTPEELEEQAQAWLRKSGIGLGWTQVLVGWIEDILATPLAGEEGLRLNRIAAGDRLAELGFYFSITELDQDALNGLFAEFGIPEVELHSSSLKGLMKGYVDLIFRCDGRYYIADYKSNHLGFEVADYGPSQLQQAMLEHRYDLQYLIYTVALHRYLGSRIPDYDYRRDFGGVFYLFLRGMQPAQGPAKGVWYDLPPIELIERLDTCFGREETP